MSSKNVMRSYRNKIFIKVWRKTVLKLSIYLVTTINYFIQRNFWETLQKWIAVLISCQNKFVKLFIWAGLMLIRKHLIKKKNENVIPWWICLIIKNRTDRSKIMVKASKCTLYQCDFCEKNKTNYFVCVF